MDTHPYGQHSTGADLLGVGLPMLTGLYPGSEMHSRVGAGMLRAAYGSHPSGHVVDSRKAYEDAAVAAVEG